MATWDKINFDTLEIELKDFYEISSCNLWGEIDTVSVHD